MRGGVVVHVEERREIADQGAHQRVERRLRGSAAKIGGASGAALAVMTSRPIGIASAFHPGGSIGACCSGEFIASKLNPGDRKIPRVRRPRHVSARRRAAAIVANVNRHRRSPWKAPNCGGHGQSK